MPPRSLRANFAWVCLANIVFAGSQCATVWLLAKLGGATLLGEYVFALSIVAPVCMFASLQLRHIQTTDANSQFFFTDYLTLRLIATAIAVVAIGGIALATAQPPRMAMLLLLLALLKAVEGVIDVFQGLLHRCDRMDHLAVAQMISALASSSALVLGTIASGELCLGIAAACAVQLMVLVPLVPLSWRVGRTTHPSGLCPAEKRAINVALHRAHALFRMSLPLGCVSLLISLTANIPRYALSHYRGVAELGVFAVLAAVIHLGDTVVAAMHQAGALRIADYRLVGDRRNFWRLFGTLAAVDLVVGGTGLILSAVFGRQLLSALLGPVFSQHSSGLTWIMLAACIAYLGSLAYTTVIAMRALPRLLLIQLVSTLTTLAACLLLVPGFGLNGAAIALGLGKVPQFALCMWLIHAKFGKDYSQSEFSSEGPVETDTRRATRPGTRSMAGGASS